MAESFHWVNGRHPGRFVLESASDTAKWPATYTRNRSRHLTKHVDRLLELGVPGDQIILAALRSKVVELSKAKTAGASPYFTTVAHTEKARSALGADRTLAVVQLVATDDDRDVNRSTAREHSTFYLGLQNYVSNLQENGFPDLKVGDEPSKELLQALVPLDGVEESIERVGEHFQAGADHVAIMPCPPRTTPSRPSNCSPRNCAA